MNFVLEHGSLKVAYHCTGVVSFSIGGQSQSLTIKEWEAVQEFVQHAMELAKGKTQPLVGPPK